jgi:hypothetical protein
MERWIFVVLGTFALVGSLTAQQVEGGETEALARFATYQPLHDLMSTTPTQGGLALTRHGTGTVVANVDFDINLGLTWVLTTVDGSGVHGFPGARQMFDPSSGPSLFVGATGSYLSSYDFRLFDLYSQPVVSKLQNPQGELFLEGVGEDGILGFHWATGAAHESNGQFLGTAADFSTIRGIGNGTLYDQSFASMGWNYVFSRLAVHLANQDDNPRQPWYAFVEYRRFVPGWGIEDSVNITGLSIADDGIFAYDGLRFGALYQTGRTAFTKVQVIAPTNWGPSYTTGLWARVGWEYTHFFEVFALPAFVDVKVGPSASPAWYFSYDATVALGITVPTSFFANAVQDSFQAP